MIVGSQKQHTFVDQGGEPEWLGRARGFCILCLMKGVLDIFSFVRTMKRIPMEQDNYCLTNQIAKRMADGEGYILGLCRIVGKQNK